MSTKNGPGGLNRREFLKVGVAGTTAAMIGNSSLAGAMQQLASPDPFAFPFCLFRWVELG